MNLFFVFGSGSDARLVTPELSGSLLPGITRDTIFAICQDLGLELKEKRITRDENGAIATIEEE